MSNDSNIDAISRLPSLKSAWFHFLFCWLQIQKEIVLFYNMYNINELRDL